MIRQHKYLTLDAIRGVAAIFVLFLHAPSKYLHGISFPHAYLAVDLFFAMSGFVIASAYDQALKNKILSTSEFIKLRIIRVYPLYLLALLTWVALMIHDSIFNGREIPSLPVLSTQIALGLIFLPSPFPLTFLFPLNGPAWSLFFELIVNFLYARFINIITTSRLWGIIFISAIALVVFSIIKGELSFGFTWQGAIGGLARVLYSFSAGLLIYNYRKKISQHTITSNSACLLVLLLTGLLLGMPITRFYVYFDIITVLIIFPALLMVASFLQPNQHAAWIFSTLGTASYGFYVLQYAFIWLYGNLLENTIEKLALPRYANLFLLITILFITSLVLNKLFDEPFRRWMKGKISYASKLKLRTVDV